MLCFHFPISLLCTIYDHLKGLTPASEELQMSQKNEEVLSEEEHYESVNQAAESVNQEHYESVNQAAESVNQAAKGTKGGGEAESIDMGLD